MRPFILLIASVVALPAQDVLFLANGEKPSGRLAGLDDKSIRLQVPLPPPAGAPADAPPVFATVTIPRAQVTHIEFAPDPARDQLLRSATPAQTPQIEALWVKFLPWLGIPRSPSARIGCAWGNLLLRAKNPAAATKALDLFQTIESSTWNDEDKMTARQGRLRAMVATGQAAQAVKEAGELAALTENPAVLMEAKYILAEAAGTSLKKLLEDNPRWEEDIHVIPERHRLYHEAMDLYLYPSLFGGAEADAAARGLWGALGIYQLVKEPGAALECARDIVVIYTNTKYAAPAKDFIASLPPTLQAINPEKKSREENAPPPKNESQKNHETKKPKSP